MTEKDPAARYRPRHVTGARRGFSALLVGVIAVTAIVSSAFVRVDPAMAAPGDPFDPDAPTVFVGQDVPTHLYTAAQGAGTITFVPESTVTTRGYNALGYNTNDNYLYAIRRDAGHTNSLLRIAQGGVVTGFGPVAGLPTINPANDAYNQGDFGRGISADVLYVRSVRDLDNLWAVNVVTQTATAIPLSATTPNTSDIVWKDGFLWGVGLDDRMYRIDPSTGDVDSWTTGLGLTQTLGASWQYGNGNLGFSENDTGAVHQVAVDNPTSGTPTFTLVSTAQGPTSGNNDGTGTAGAEVDLGIVKSGPATYAPGDAIEYTLTVANGGPGDSSGFVVNDTLPSSIDAPTTSTPGCTIDGDQLQCIMAALPLGGTADIEITGAISAGATGVITNTATVIGNELDPNPANDTDTTEATPEPQANLQITKTPTPAVVTAVGEEVTYAFEVTNTSDVPIDDIELVDVQAPPAGALTSGPDCPETTLAAMASMICTATYVTTAADIAHGRIDDTATATGGSAGTPIVSNEATATVLAEPILDWTLAKTAFVGGAELADGATVLPGDTLTYQVTATNQASIDIADVEIMDDLAAVLDDATFVTGSADLIVDGGSPVAVADPAGAVLTAGPFTLPVGTSVVLTYQVTVDDDAWSRTLTNTVGAESPTSPPEDCAEECSTTQITPAVVQILKVGEDAAGDIVAMDGSAWAIYDAVDATVPLVDPVDPATEGGTPVTGLFQDTNLPAGTYWLEETVALAGFELLAERVEFTVGAAGEMTLGASTAANVSVVDIDGIDTIRVEDMPALDLPDAGGPGTSPIHLTGFALIVGALLAASGLVARARVRRRLAETIAHP